MTEEKIPAIELGLIDMQLKYNCKDMLDIICPIDEIIENILDRYY